MVEDDKKAYGKRQYAPVPKNFYRIRGAISHAISERIEKLDVTQLHAAEIAGIGQSRMNAIVGKRFTNKKTGRETVQAWNMLEVLMSLGAHITVSVESYSSPGSGSIEFINHG